MNDTNWELELAALAKGDKQYRMAVLAYEMGKRA